MSLFGTKIEDSEQERQVLIAAKSLSKNSTLPQPSIRADISQAMKDLGFAKAKIGQSGEIHMTGTLRRYGEIPADSVESVEKWGQTAGSDAIQQAYATAIDGLKK